jgi:hypothetical protein
LIIAIMPSDQEQHKFDAEVQAVKEWWKVSLESREMVLAFLLFATLQ